MRLGITWRDKFNYTPLTEMPPRDANSRGVFIFRQNGKLRGARIKGLTLILERLGSVDGLTQ